MLNAFVRAHCSADAPEMKGIALSDEMSEESQRNAMLSAYSMAVRQRIEKARRIEREKESLRWCARPRKRALSDTTSRRAKRRRRCDMKLLNVILWTRFVRRYRECVNGEFAEFMGAAVSGLSFDASQRERLRALNQRRRELMDGANPKYILRNYLMEQAIQRAKHRDYGKMVWVEWALQNDICR